jgi:hypothetical protein
MITKEQVEAAKKDRSHIAIKTLNDLGESYWIDVARRAESDRDKRQEIYTQGYIPFTQALKGESFTLNPLEIISIWSRASELFEGEVPYPRYRLSTSLSCLYGAMNIESGPWKTLYEGICDERVRPFNDLVEKDGENAIKFRDRLYEIDKSLGQIKVFYNGTTEDISELCKKERLGDESAKNKIDAIAENQERNDGNGFLRKISENWGNGMYWMFGTLPDK